VAGLFLLALPVASSLQFVAGFPMRLAASNIASWMLQTSGAGVTAEGTGLRWSGGVIEIDSPCSGIRMLWAGLYFGLTSACAYRANAIRTFGVLVTAVVAVVLGNALRSAALFYLEAGLTPVTCSWASIIHSGVGLIVFSGIAAGTLACARW
jgi:exosortase/archaeosortase family protein